MYVLVLDILDIKSNTVNLNFLDFDTRESAEKFADELDVAYENDEALRVRKALILPKGE